MNKETLLLIESFEKENNISIAVTFYSDGSYGVEEFWNDQKLNEGKSNTDLNDFLKKTKYKKDEKGLCLSPCVSL